jgi:predicted CopG family antitoxin
MSQIIRISEDLYQRLETYAQGFDTPSKVIEKMINFYENKNNIKPKSINSEKKYTNLEIIYYPSNDIELFKQNLIMARIAYIKLYKINNEIEIKKWNAYRFTKDSDVEKNLRSGYLRGWKNKGIFKAELSINKGDFN